MKKLLNASIAALTMSSVMSFADDTELYLIERSSITGKRPQILFIFDNSGSMSTEQEDFGSSYCLPESAEPECAAFNEYAQKYAGYINEKGIYWNAGGIDNISQAPTPDDPNDSRRFNVENNNCKSAKDALAAKGRYTGYIRELESKSNTLTWVSLAENEGLNKKPIVDCYEDFSLGSGADNNPGTGVAGYPADTNKSEGGYLLAKDDEQNFRTGSVVTLYSAHYLVWYEWVTKTEDGQNSGSTGSRLEVAKKALNKVLLEWSDPDTGLEVDAGLAVFNLNHAEEGDADGGRIVYPITHMTDTNRSTLTNIIDGMSAQTNTPLCETLYEAYQYFSGGPVTFGNKDANANGQDKIDDYVPNTPPSIIGSGNYTSPFKKCPDTAYIVYITDGAPTLDSNANSYIKALTTSAEVNADYSPYPFINEDGETENSYLPALAAYMANNDLVEGVKDINGVDHDQNVRVFTIGFSNDALAAAPLLEETAFRSGSPRNNGVSSGYIYAEEELDLSEAFNSVLKSIFSVDSSFTSPSIASNNFDKTQTYNSAYFAMFLPGKGPRWSGNLKKLKVNSSGEIVAPGDGTKKAIDDNGNISASICTYWNTCETNNPDGNKVNAGGVLPNLRSKLKSRNILSMSSSGIIDIKASSFVADYSQEDLDWLYGVDVDDDNNTPNTTTDARIDIMGDPLHSKPLAINFGEKPNADGTENLDVRVIVGTNQGLVHMFKDSDSGSSDFKVESVDETWAIIPNELWGNVPRLRSNPPTGVHSVYGMDLSPVAYTETDSTGKVNKAWLFLGMRRGGSSIYALNITNPDTPKFMWVINSDTAGFEDLGDSWSEPTVTFIPGRDDPVLIFGGGMATTQGNGDGVYIVDAVTGSTLVKKFTHPEMNSVPNKVAVLDSNNDGITDRIYASDIGGNIWRMDLPSTDSSTWSIFKFAQVNSGSEGRKFFSEPVVAQTQFSNISSTNGVVSYQEVPYDAVAIGSGNREKPVSDTITNDMFYVFQDRNVVSKAYSGTDVPATLTVADLYDVTSNAPDPDDKTQQLAFGLKRGWYFDFSVSGEKSLSSSLIFDGKVYFTSFVPPTSSAIKIDFDLGICGSAGEGRLYVLDLHRGTRSYSQLYFDIGERVPDTPQIVIPKPEDGKEPQAYIIGVGKGECEGAECKGTVALGSGLTTNRIYYHIDE